LIGGAFTVAAFTEPTTSPSNTTSYPPINVGPETQYVDGPLGIGNGTTVADSTKTSAASFYVMNNLLTDATVVRQNANFVSNVEIEGRNVFAGLLRVAQASVTSATSGLSSYDTSGTKLFFPKGTTTNLISGNYCTTATDTACPMGTVFYKYDSSNGKATCRYINPVKSAGSIGNCSSVSSNVAVSLTNTSSDTNTCRSTRTYTASGSSSGYAWYIKGVADSDWTYFGTGTTKNVVVVISGASSTKSYDLIVRDSSYPVSNAAIEVFSVTDNACTSQQTGGTTGGTGQ
jgi:hypothetical protein